MGHAIRCGGAGWTTGKYVSINAWYAGRSHDQSVMIFATVAVFVLLTCSAMIDTAAAMRGSHGRLCVYVGFKKHPHPVGWFGTNQN